MRFYDVTASSVLIDPRIVVGFAIAVILLEIFLGLVVK